MPCYEIDGVKPVIHPSSYVHPTAVIIGLVTIGKNCYIGPHASIRGDYGQIIFEDGVNFQDGCIAHAFPGGHTTVRENGHISHGAVLHGCEIGANCMIGIQTVIMDNAIIGPECMIAALSYIKPKFEAPARSVIAGSPAEIKRSVTDKEMHWKTKGTAVYHDLTQRSLSTMIECDPLSEKTNQKIDLNIPQFKPLK
ncbi:transferase hexapeptide repeat family protein [Marinicella rhabdoformis]|uniref:transferase hexapeptide repeat family protein n=1 Tax=Marinicella rhabdoformis TaxID=2580566 RepID=UPI0012AEDCFD|nr:transferase hexapeptide repeat family protein [Marinicella rhabdoformis]